MNLIAKTFHQVENNFFSMVSINKADYGNIIAFIAPYLEFMPRLVLQQSRFLIELFVSKLNPQNDIKPWGHNESTKTG